MTPTAVAAAQAAGATVSTSDRSPTFAAPTPPAPLSIPLRPAFASWLGWLAPHDTPLVVVRDPDQDLDEVLWQAAKIGYDNIVGEARRRHRRVDRGRRCRPPPHAVTAATAARRACACSTSGRTSEYRRRTRPGRTRTSSSATSRGAIDQLADVPTVVMCGHGERAMGAASLLTGPGSARRHRPGRRPRGLGRRQRPAAGDRPVTPTP